MIGDGWAYDDDLWHVEVVVGDLLDQDVDAIVSPWTRNFVRPPVQWPSATSLAIRHGVGRQPFRDLARWGAMRLGDAVVTGGGRSLYRGIIHVATINLRGRSKPEYVATGTRAALQLAAAHGFHSIAFPLLGADGGGLEPELALNTIRDVAQQQSYDLDVVRIVRDPEDRYPSPWFGRRRRLPEESG